MNEGNSKKTLQVRHKRIKEMCDEDVASESESQDQEDDDDHKTDVSFDQLETKADAK